MHTTITVPEISERLGICEESVYEMLRSHEIPNIRHGHRFIISRAAYERWEATIGESASTTTVKTVPTVEVNRTPVSRSSTRPHKAA